MEDKKTRSGHLSYSNFFPHVIRQRRQSSRHLHQKEVKSNRSVIGLRSTVMDSDAENSSFIPYRTGLIDVGPTNGSLRYKSNHQEMMDKGAINSSSIPYILAHKIDSDESFVKTETSPEKFETNSSPVVQHSGLENTTSTKTGVSVLGKNAELGRIDNNPTQTAGFHSSSDLCPSTVTDLLMDPNANKEFDLISHILEESSEESSQVQKPSRETVTLDKHGLSPRLFEEDSVTEFDSVSNVGMSLVCQRKTIPPFEAVSEEGLSNSYISLRKDFEYPYSQREFLGKEERGKIEVRSEKVRPYHLQHISSYNGEPERGHASIHKGRYMPQNPDSKDFGETYPLPNPHFEKKPSVPDDFHQRLPNQYPRDLQSPVITGINPSTPRGLGDETSGYISESYLSNCRRLSGSDNTIAYQRQRALHRNTNPEENCKHPQQDMHQFRNRQHLNINPQFQPYTDGEHTKIVERSSIDRHQPEYLCQRRLTDLVKKPSRKSINLPNFQHLEIGKKTRSSSNPRIFDERPVISPHQESKLSGRASAPPQSAYPLQLSAGFDDSYPQGRISAPPPRCLPDPEDERVGFMSRKNVLFGQCHTSKPSQTSSQVPGRRCELGSKTYHSNKELPSTTGKEVTGDFELGFNQHKRGNYHSTSRNHLSRNLQPYDTMKRAESSRRLIKDLSRLSWNHTSKQFHRFNNDRADWIENPTETHEVSPEVPPRELEENINEQRITYSPENYNYHRSAVNEHYCQTESHGQNNTGIKSMSNASERSYRPTGYLAHSKRFVKNIRNEILYRNKFDKGMTSVQSDNNQRNHAKDAEARMNRIQNTQLTMQQTDEHIAQNSAKIRRSKRSLLDRGVEYVSDDDNSLCGQDQDHTPVSLGLQDQQLCNEKIKCHKDNLGICEETVENAFADSDGSIESQSIIEMISQKGSCKAPNKYKNIDSKDGFQSPTKIKKKHNLSRHCLQTGWDEDNDNDFLDSPIKPLEEYPFPRRHLRSKKALKRPCTYISPKDTSLSLTCSGSLNKKRKKLGIPSRHSTNSVRKMQLPQLDKGHEDFWETPLKETEDCICQDVIPDNLKCVYSACKKRKLCDDGSNDGSDNDPFVIDSSSEVSSIITKVRSQPAQGKTTIDHGNLNVAEMQPVQINEDLNILDFEYGQSTQDKDSSEHVEAKVEKESNAKDLKTSKTKLTRGEESIGKDGKKNLQANKRSKIKDNQCKDQKEMSQANKGPIVKSYQSTKLKEKSQADEESNINKSGSTDQTEKTPTNEYKVGPRKKGRKRKRNILKPTADIQSGYNLRKNSLNTSTEEPEEFPGHKSIQEDTVKDKNLLKKSPKKKLSQPKRRSSRIENITGNTAESETRSDSEEEKKSLKVIPNGQEQSGCRSSQIESELKEMNESQFSFADCNIDDGNQDGCQNNHVKDVILGQTKENQKADKMKKNAHDNNLKSKGTKGYPKMKTNSQEKSSNRNMISKTDIKSDSSFNVPSPIEISVGPPNQVESVIPHASTDETGTSHETSSTIGTSETLSTLSNVQNKSSTVFTTSTLPIATSTNSIAPNKTQATNCQAGSNVGNTNSGAAKLPQTLEAFPLNIEGLFLNGPSGLQLIGWKPLSHMTGNMMMQNNSNIFGSSFDIGISCPLSQIPQGVQISKGMKHQKNKTLALMSQEGLSKPQKVVLQTCQSPVTAINNQNPSTVCASITKPLVNSVKSTRQASAQTDKSHFCTSHRNLKNERFPQKSKPVLNEKTEKICGTNKAQPSRLPEKTGFRKYKTRMEGYVPNAPKQAASIQYQRPLNTCSGDSIADCSTKSRTSNKPVDKYFDQELKQNDQIFSTEVSLKSKESSISLNHKPAPSDFLTNLKDGQPTSNSEFTKAHKFMHAKSMSSQRSYSVVGLQTGTVPIKNSNLEATLEKSGNERNLKGISQNTSITSPVIKTINPKTLTANIRIQSPNNATSQVLLIPVFKMSPAEGKPKSLIVAPSALSLSGSKELSEGTLGQNYSDSSPSSFDVSSTGRNLASSLKIPIASETERSNKTAVIIPLQSTCNSNKCNPVVSSAEVNRLTALPTSPQNNIANLGNIKPNLTVSLNTDTTVSPSNYQLQLSSRNSLYDNQYLQTDMATDIIGGSCILSIHPHQSEGKGIATFPKERQEPSVQLPQVGSSKNSELPVQESLLLGQEIIASSIGSYSTSDSITNNTSLDKESSKPHANKIKESFQESFETVFPQELSEYPTSDYSVNYVSLSSNSSILVCQKSQKSFHPSNKDQQAKSQMVRNSSDPFTAPATKSEKETDTRLSTSILDADKSNLRNNFALKDGFDMFQSHHHESNAEKPVEEFGKETDEEPENYVLPNLVAHISNTTNDLTLKQRLERLPNETIVREDGKEVITSAKAAKNEKSSDVDKTKALTLKSSKSKQRIITSRGQCYVTACPEWNFRRKTLKSKYRNSKNSFVNLSNVEFHENIKFRNLRNRSFQTVFNYEGNSGKKKTRERKNNVQSSQAELPKDAPKVLDVPCVKSSIMCKVKSSCDKGISNESSIGSPKRRKRRNQKSLRRRKRKSKCTGDMKTICTKDVSQNFPSTEKTENIRKQLDCFSEGYIASSITLKENVSEHPKTISQVDFAVIQNENNQDSVDEVKFLKNTSLTMIFDSKNTDQNLGDTSQPQNICSLINENFDDGLKQIRKFKEHAEKNETIQSPKGYNHNPKKCSKQPEGSAQQTDYSTQQPVDSTDQRYDSAQQPVEYTQQPEEYTKKTEKYTLQRKESTTAQQQLGLQQKQERRDEQLENPRMDKNFSGSSGIISKQLIHAKADKDHTNVQLFNTTGPDSYEIICKPSIAKQISAKADDDQTIGPLDDIVHSLGQTYSKVSDVTKASTEEGQNTAENDPFDATISQGVRKIEKNLINEGTTTSTDQVVSCYSNSLDREFSNVTFSILNSEETCNLFSSNDIFDKKRDEFDSVVSRKDLSASVDSDKIRNNLIVVESTLNRNDLNENKDYNISGETMMNHKRKVNKSLTEQAFSVTSNEPALQHDEFACLGNNIKEKDDIVSRTSSDIENCMKNIVDVVLDQLEEAETNDKNLHNQFDDCSSGKHKVVVETRKSDITCQFDVDSKKKNILPIESNTSKLSTNILLSTENCIQQNKSSLSQESENHLPYHIEFLSENDTSLPSFLSRLGEDCDDSFFMKTEMFCNKRMENSLPFDKSLHDEALDSSHSPSQTKGSCQIDETPQTEQSGKIPSQNDSDNSLITCTQKNEDMSDGDESYNITKEVRNSFPQNENIIKSPGTASGVEIGYALLDDIACLGGNTKTGELIAIKSPDITGFANPDEEACLEGNDKGDWTDEIISPVSEIKQGMEFSLIPVKNRAKKPELIITCGKCGRTFQRHYTFEKHKAAHIKKELKEASDLCKQDYQNCNHVCPVQNQSADFEASEPDLSRSFFVSPVDGYSNCENKSASFDVPKVEVIQLKRNEEKQMPDAAGGTKKSITNQRMHDGSPEKMQLRERGRSALTKIGKNCTLVAHQHKRSTKEINSACVTSRRRSLPGRKVDDLMLQVTRQRRSFPMSKSRNSKRDLSPIRKQRKVSPIVCPQAPIRNGKNPTLLSGFTKGRSQETVTKREQGIYNMTGSPQKAAGLNNKSQIDVKEVVVAVVDKESHKEVQETIIAAVNNQRQTEVDKTRRDILKNENPLEMEETGSVLADSKSQSEMNETGSALVDSENQSESEEWESLREKRQGENWKCQYCPKEFQRKYRYHRHLYEEHSDKNWKKIQCWFCQSWFPWHFKIPIHIMMQHKDKIKKEIAIYTCNSCPATAKNFGHLHSHYQFNHENELKAIIRKTIPNDAIIVEVFACEICGEFRLKIEELEAHLSEIHNSLKNVHVRKEILRKHESFMFCLYCSSKFSSVEDTNKHINSSHLSLVRRLKSNTKHQCLFCEKVLWNEYEMKKHVGTNHSIEEKIVNIEKRLEVVKAKA